MGNWSKEQEEKKEGKEKNKVRKENIAKYFLDLSKLAFTALVLGVMISFFQNFCISANVISMAVCGVLLASLLAGIGNNILK